MSLQSLSSEQVIALIKNSPYGRYTFLMQGHDVDGHFLSSISSVSSLLALETQSLKFSEGHAAGLLDLLNGWKNSGVEIAGSNRSAAGRGQAGE